MKIGLLFLTYQPGKGGLEQVVKTVTRSLADKNYQFYIYGIHQPVDQDFLQYAVKTKFIKYPSWVENKPILMPKFLHRFLTRKYRENRLLNLLEEAEKDKIESLIILNLHKQYSQNYRTLKKFKKTTHIPIISWPHGTLFATPKKFRRKLKKQVSLFDGHLAISSGIKQELKNLYNVESTHLIYNPIPEPNKIISRQNNRFLFIGRIDENKRLQGILQQLKKVQDDWHLDIFGSTGNISEDKALVNYISKLGLCNKITFHGWTLDPWSKINSAGLLLLNSKQEGFPLVIAEALIRGIPVLSSNCPVGPNELITHEKNGWLYEVNNEEAIHQILQAILSKAISLPSEKDCQNSVSHLKSQVVVRNFINALKKITHNFKTYN